MEVISLNSTNFIGLSSVYSPDSLLSFNQGTYVTEQGISLPLASVLAGANDSTTNNYSNLFLTQSQPLSDIAYIQNLSPIMDPGFTTYLSVDSGAEQLFVAVQELSSTNVRTSIYMDLVGNDIQNSNLFTIIFVNNDLCKIEHVNVYSTQYLTMGSDSSLYFTYDLGTDYLGDQSPQLFYYVYDRQNSNISFFKNIQDFPYYVCATGNTLFFTAPLTGVDPFVSTAVFNCLPRPEEPTDTLLYDPWVSYKKDFLTNTQNIDSSRTFANVNSNLLLNSQYLTVSGGTLPVNILSLKNTNTPENFQSRNNPYQSNKSPYLSENDVEFREYTKLYTGSNQALGNDSITIGFESYTTDIVLKPDKITYFHVPQTIYPYTQINISDAGLIEAGAIAGDHPIKSDKIFKKLANAKDTSPFGAATDNELNGSFLCSWLSGSSDIKVSPIWVDRYYIPSKITAVTALTSRTIKANTYSTVLEGYAKLLGVIQDQGVVFDVLSDLVFEPSCYYAYHHYGPSDVDNYLNIFGIHLVEKDFPNYLTSALDTTTIMQPTSGEYSFDDGTKYAITDSLSGIQLSNQFTLCFDMYNQDWQKPFGNQIIGNLVNDGFGVFNQNIITPTIFVPSITGNYSDLNILNTDFNNIKTVVYPTTASPLAYIRAHYTENYSVVFNDGFIRQYTCDDNLLRQSFSPYLTSIVSFTNNNSTAYILCTGTNTNNVLSANLISNTINIIPSYALYNNSYFAPDAGNNALNRATTINSYNGNLYFTPGSVARRTGDTIYYLTDNRTSIVKWSSIGTSQTNTITAFKAVYPSTFADFNIDYDGNVWIINNANKFYKYTTNNELLLSGSLISNTPQTITLSITGDGATTVFPFSAAGLMASEINVVINNNILRPLLDYTLSGNNIVFQHPIAVNTFGTASVVLFEDTYQNYKINFVSEFANSSYYTNTLFARTGTGYTQANSNAPILSGQTYQFVYLDTNGTPLSSTFFLAASGLLPLTNTDYLREYVQGTYSPSNLNIKTIASNIYDSTDLSVNEIIYSLSALDPGYHHFAIRFDAYHGFMSLFVDAQVVGSVQFTPRKYKFSNLVYRPFLIGSSNFNNSTPLYKYLNKNAYLTENIKIRNFYLYDTPLKDYDIIMHARKSRDIQDVHLNIPCGRRNYLEEIERYFKANTPGAKATQYNVIVRNTGITDSTLQGILQANINNILANSAPAYTKLNTIKWIN